MTPTLYIMVRNDMASMTGGKAAAQASHATNDFELRVSHGLLPPWTIPTLKKWREDRTFGRGLVLGIDDTDMNALIHAHENVGIVDVPQYLFGSIIDPTYPVRDGSVTHLVPVRTAAWMFTYDNAKTVYDEYVGRTLHTPMSWVETIAYGEAPRSFLPLKIVSTLKLFK